MTTVSFPQRERTALFIAAERTLVAEMGSVSIVKFLGGTEEGEAQAKWFRALEAFLEALPDGVFVGSDVTSGRPVLTFAGGVDATIRLYHLHLRPSFFDAWRIVVRPGLAPALVDAVAASLWGAEWEAAIVAAAGESSYPVNPAGDQTSPWETEMRDEIGEVVGADDPRARGWIVRAAPTEAPWPWFSDERRARRAARALAWGQDAVNALYREFAGGPHE